MTTPMTTSSLSAEEQIRHNEEEHEYTGVWFAWERLGKNFDDNKLTLEGFGMFGQYDAIGTVAFDNDAAFETIGDATFYVVVRENAGLGTIIVQTQDQVICNTEKISENIKIETQAPMSAAGG